MAVNYFVPLAQLIRVVHHDLARSDNDTFQLYAMMGTYADTIGDAFLRYDATTLAKNCDLQYNSHTPTVHEWFAFLNDKYVMEWVNVRVRAMLRVGSQKVAEKLQRGEFNKNTDVQVGRFLEDMRRYEQAQAREHISVYTPFPPLLGPNPNGVEIDEEDT